MNQWGIGVCLLLLTGAASAEWTFVGDTGNALHFVDTSSTQRIGNTRKMWDLSDYKAQQTKAKSPFFSSASLWEYDCSNMKNRRMVLTMYSGRMGAGQVVYTSADVDSWKAPSLNSLAMVLLKIACEK